MTAGEFVIFLIKLSLIFNQVLLIVYYCEKQSTFQSKCSFYNLYLGRELTFNF